MKGKIPSIVMVFVAVALVTSLVAGVAMVPNTATAATDSWSRMDLPTTLKYQMFPDSDIWALNAADDGTLFALVEDTSGAVDGFPIWDGARWAVFPAYSDVALMKSTDGGYTWSLAWHIPASELGWVVDVVPAPGYTDPGVVFLATGGPALGTGNLYRSLDGGTTFTRVVPVCPGVTAGGVITSVDVAEDMVAAGEYLAVVGVSSLFWGGLGEGVYTWNENGVAIWLDKEAANALPPAPFPGNMPAGSGLDVIAVMFSPGYTTDGQIVAVVNDILGILAPTGIYVCFWDGIDGAWGGDVDSPTNAPINLTGDAALAASMAVGDDYTKTSMTYVFVGLTGCGVAANNDVWRIRGLATVTGPSTATATNLFVTVGAVDSLISSVIVDGIALMGTLYVGCEFPAGQAQVYSGTNPIVWPAWTPSAIKPPSGAAPVLLTDTGSALVVAGGTDGFTRSGVSVKVDALLGKVYNGIGLLDDIAVSEDIPGTGWTLAEGVSEEVSPDYANDSTLYVGTFSGWTGSLSLWRWDGSNWERILVERLTLPSVAVVGFAQHAGKPMLTNAGTRLFVNDWTWFPRVSPAFPSDPFMFVLGGLSESVFGWIAEMLWYSLDKGDTWAPVATMPIGAIPVGGGLSETGWWVQDNSTVFCGDMNGVVYKTTDRGDSWTEGARTAIGVEVTTIQPSPIYSEAGGVGSDMCVLVGTFDPIGLVGLMEVWISQDGAIADFENVGAEINTDPGVSWGQAAIGGTVVSFDGLWDQNGTVYAGASGWLDRWQLIGLGATELTRVDSSDLGVYRTTVNRSDPSASTWEKIWGADDFNAAAPNPQPLAGMVPGQDVFRYVVISGLATGQGTIYAPFALWDMSYNNPLVLPSPNGLGRFTLGGVLRCLDGTQATTEWNLVNDGLGAWDGLWLARAVPGASNTVISLALDWREWRFKLATYDDTLCGAGPAAAAPADGATNVGEMVGEGINVVLEWESVGGTTYQWQVDNDSGFTAPLIAEGTTTETFAQVTGLETSSKYFWRVRVIQPAVGAWSGPYSFTTVIGAGVGAPALLSPEAGAVGVSSKPTFQWGALSWATSYQLMVAAEPFLVGTPSIINETVTATAYQPTAALGGGTYYWQVKAMSDTAESGWSATGVFTVGAAPGVGTPAWVWVLIVIGAILAIAVIVLIVRTRRPV